MECKFGALTCGEVPSKERIDAYKAWLLVEDTETDKLWQWTVLEDVDNEQEDSNNSGGGQALESKCTTSSRSGITLEAIQ